ncbi:bifunctional methionine sulfoxide reductase B/A protein [Microbacter margulisiae]|uniref:Peptide methionine sulfoxide reductase MsrA n=1 Tax=Microbacter margulisiae TaxID=1350067 RepID=A0A7W5DQ67_9PORP|nr:bifunctional methionine sulfoxide reductase B/A protein [Microbacter margulisiae]MBB3187034.1 peptide methionine sulfoxide reductase msrA/msrB [Microbacter margulisiae]
MNIKIFLGFILTLALNCTSQCQTHNDTLTEIRNPAHYVHLTPEEAQVMLHRGTEAPFTGNYVNTTTRGTYYCKQCHAPLFRSSDKFASGCGWPSFDDAIKGAVKLQLDPDGHRMEVICANCGAHLGHLFLNEGFTPKEKRYCINSIAMIFVPDSAATLKTAYFAAGCFWGTEYFFMHQKGVVNTTVGYMGGHVKNPTYEEVSSHKTGHFETVKVEYNPQVVSYEDLAKLFFEMHDFTQTNGQGVDIGPQYRSVIFYGSKNQRRTAEELIRFLTNKGYNVATMLIPVSTFWKAEAYHQHYYENQGEKPACHTLNTNLFH